jgi:hypothetical protein
MQTHWYSSIGYEFLGLKNPQLFKAVLKPLQKMFHAEFEWCAFTAVF